MALSIQYTPMQPLEQFCSRVISGTITNTSPFYGRPDLYNSYLIAREYHQYEQLFDILVGTYGSSRRLYIICLWEYPPQFEPDDDNILFVVRPPILKKIEMDLFNVTLDTSYLFESHDLVSWVAFGNYDNQTGYIVGIRFPYVTPYGKRRIPERYRGHRVFQIANPYKPCDDYRSPIRMGDQIGPIELSSGYGTLGGFLKDASGRVYGISNCHVLYERESTPHTLVLQPARMSVPDDVDNFKGYKYYSIGRTYLGFRSNIKLNGTKMGFDVGLIELKVRKYEGCLRDYKYNGAILPLTYTGKVRHPEKNERVFKYGATSKITRGLVSVFEMSLRDCPQYCFYSHIEKSMFDKDIILFEPMTFYNQVAFQNSISNVMFGFCVPGDSGSLAIGEDGATVALLYGCLIDHSYGFGTDMVHVMDYLEGRMGKKISLLASKDCIVAPSH